MDCLRYHELAAFFQGAADIFSEKKEELCEMDANMGDGDLVLTMEKGFGALPQLIRENGEDGNIGKTLMKAGMKMSSLVPSTMGTLMASGIMEGGKAIGGRMEIGPEGFSEFLDGFVRGIERRGKCRPGDRTLLDAMDAAAKKALEASRDGADMAGVIPAAAEGAKAGAAATKDMLPRFGKAAVFSARAIGVPDQGAVAGQYLLEGLERYFQTRPDIKP